jgi:putative ABC transport system permease protein
VRNALVIGEISAALVLLLATALLVQGLLRLQAVHPGFNPDHVFQARLSLPPSYRTPEQLTRFYHELSRRVRTLPGVRDVGVISAAPLSGLLATVPFSVTGQPSRSARESPNANLRVITPGYLAVAGTRLLKGRPFSERDTANAPPVALVSEAFADRFLGDGAIVQQLRIDDNNTGPRPVTVVGIVENVRQVALDGPPDTDIYIPLAQLHPDGTPLLRNNQFWMIKTGTEPDALRTPFLSHLRSVDRDAAISSTGTMDQFLDAWLAPRRFSLGLFVAFSLSAVLLAVSGLYGLVSYTVSQRRREIGVRLAIGATGRDVHRLILNQAAHLALAGTALGLGVALVARPVAARLVTDGSIDLGMMAATAALLCAVVIMAAWMPARRAARVEPSLALKGD